jgi:hypothetical protein
MLRQIFTTDLNTLKGMIADGKQGRGPKIVAQLPGTGKVDVHDVRKQGERLQVQLEPQGQWHTPQPQACFKDEPDK